MPRSGSRTRIGEGLYRDRSGISAVIKVGSHQKEKRFPLGTETRLMQHWRDATKVKLQKRQPQAPRGTFAADAAKYIRLVTHLASLKARKAELSAWVKRFPDRHRNTITPADVMTARGEWLDAGTSPKTINNRVQTLRHLYKTLDGREVETPCDALTPLPVARTPAVVISDAKVREVEATLAGFESVRRLLDAKTRARFRVLASTGKRPSEIMRAEPTDVDLERRVWIVRDGKGGYSPGLYLNDDMIAAWQLFIAADAWGAYNTNSLARTLRSAGWPKGVRPYNLRHATWITASERGADLSDIQAGAGHKSLATTRLHYVPVRDSRMQKLSELLEGRFGWATVPATGASRDVMPPTDSASSGTIPAAPTDGPDEAKAGSFTE